MPNAAAQVHLDAANAAMQSYDFAGSADAVAKAYAEDPDDLDVNVEYLQRYPMRHYRWTGRTIEVEDQYTAKADIERFNSEMKATYTQRVSDEPGAAKWHFLLARLAGKDSVAVERHLTDCLAADPTFADAYADLALVCQKRGDNEGHLSHLLRCAELQPEEGYPWFSHAFSCAGPARKKALLAYVARFPDHERVGQALMEAASEATDLDERITLLQQAVDSAAAPHLAVYAATQLLAVLAPTDPDRAAAVADGLGEQFADTATGLRAIAAAGQAFEGGDAAAALAALDAAPSQLLAGGDVARLLRIKALVSAGDVEQARKVLVERLTTTSSPELWALADSVGDRAGIEADVWAARDASSTVAPDFDVPDVDGGRITLDDRRGRVTLVNFWYPSCGPCRNEFRFLAPIIGRFDGRPFEVLVVNTMDVEDGLVVPFMTGNGYPFTPTLFDAAIVEAYEVRGTPANFVIDHEGRVQFRPGVHSTETAETLAALIDELVTRAEAQAVA